MNNLQKMYNWLIENQDKIKPNFNINYYRESINDNRNHECNSTGCLIGWGVGAFPIEEIPIEKRSKMILFREFIESVLRIGILTSKWKFIFDSEWHYTEYNSFDDAMSRYKHVLDEKPIKEHPQYKTFLKYIK